MPSTTTVKKSGAHHSRMAGTERQTLCVWFLGVNGGALRPPCVLEDASLVGLSGLVLSRNDASMGRQVKNRKTLDLTLHPPDGMSFGDFAFVHRVLSQKPTERPGYLLMHLAHHLLPREEGGMSSDQAGQTVCRAARATEIGKLLSVLKGGEVGNLLVEAAALEWMPVVNRIQGYSEGGRAGVKARNFCELECYLFPPENTGDFAPHARTGSGLPDGWVLACANAIWGPLELRFDGSLRRTERSGRNDLWEKTRSYRATEYYAVARFCAQLSFGETTGAVGGLASKLEATMRSFAEEIFGDGEDDLPASALYGAKILSSVSFPWLGATQRISPVAALLFWALDQRSALDFVVAETVLPPSSAPFCLGSAETHPPARQNSLLRGDRSDLWSGGGGIHGRRPEDWTAECTATTNWFAGVSRQPDLLAACCFCAYYVLFKFREPWMGTEAEASLELQRLSHAQFLLKLACLASLHPSMDAAQALASTNRERIHSYVLDCVEGGVATSVGASPFLGGRRKSPASALP